MSSKAPSSFRSPDKGEPVALVVGLLADWVEDGELAGQGCHRFDEHQNCFCQLHFEIVARC